MITNLFVMVRSEASAERLEPRTSGSNTLRPSRRGPEGPLLRMTNTLARHGEERASSERLEPRTLGPTPCVLRDADLRVRSSG